MQVNLFILYHVFFPSSPGKAAADQNAAWAAYYAHYYGQQPGGAVGAQAPGAPGEQPQAAQAPGGQPDYAKAWEEYFKKFGMSELEILRRYGSYIRTVAIYINLNLRLLLLPEKE